MGSAPRKEIPPGGTTGQVLAKVSNADRDIDWQTVSSGVSDHFLLTNIGTKTHVEIDAHIADLANPHSVTKSQVGLSNVDNTPDLNKPISTLTQSALDNKQPLASVLTNTTESYTTAIDSRLANTSGTNTGDQTISLTGDTTGSGTGSFPTAVASVGGKTAAQVSTSVDDTLAATALNTPSAIVKRDASGNVALGKLALSGSPIDPNIFFNLNVTQTPVASTFGIFNQINVPSNPSNLATTGFRNLVLSTNTQNMTRRYIGLLNAAEHNGTGNFTGSGGLVGTDSYGQLDTGASAGLVAGSAGTCSNITTGSINNGYGGLFAMNNIGAGTVTAGHAISASFGNFNAASVITTAYGVRVANIFNSGTIGTTYGFHVGNLTAGTQTNKPYSFYATDTAAYNYFAGSTKFGAGTSIPTTGFSFDNNGGFRTESSLGEMIRATNSGLSFFGNTAVTKQSSSGPATAGAVYSATEQTMIQEMYNALRNYGLLT